MNPNLIYPNKKIKEIVFIKNIDLSSNIKIGNYTYYDDPLNEKNKNEFLNHVTHHYDFIGDKLIIGNFCSIARGVEFMMNGANHSMNGISTYPFNIMGQEWGKFIPKKENLTIKGDTIVGNDVWIGQNVTILPGIKIGNGAIIGANSLVTNDVPDYSVVGGNPSKIIRYRFDNKKIDELNKLKWWNKNIDWITQHIPDLI